MIDDFEIELGGAVIAGAELGEGLPVVFLHAGVCDHRMWRGQMEVVAAAGFHAIAYDRRGYGETTSPDETFNHLEDLEGVLDALDVHAAILVGCSMGGGLAIDFALAHPGRTIGLVLVGTSITGASSFVTDPEQPLVMAEEDAEERGDLDMLNKVQAHAWLDGPRSQNGRVWGAARELFFDMNDKALRQPPLTHEEPRPRAVDRLESINTPLFWSSATSISPTSCSAMRTPPRRCPTPSPSCSKAPPTSPTSNVRTSSIPCCCSFSKR